ncbi:hypothetical protein B0H13DRAFT_1901049 [Mycena leptocephala]|nr:hypothetical protein B0H13DRAFT_1901049 [Mycena leptocephala]
MALAKRTDFTCPNTDLAGNPLLAATLTHNDGGVTVPGLPDVPGLGICQYGSGFCDYDPECQCLSFFQRYPIINVAIFWWTIQRAHPNLEPFRYCPLDSLHTGCTTIFPAISPPRVVAPGKASFYLRAPEARKTAEARVIHSDLPVVLHLKHLRPVGLSHILLPPNVSTTTGFYYAKYGPNRTIIGEEPGSSSNFISAVGGTTVLQRLGKLTGFISKTRPKGFNGGLNFCNGLASDWADTARAHYYDPVREERFHVRREVPGNVFEVRPSGCSGDMTKMSGRSLSIFPGNYLQVPISETIVREIPLAQRGNGWVGPSGGLYGKGELFAPETAAEVLPVALGVPEISPAGLEGAKAVVSVGVALALAGTGRTDGEKKKKEKNRGVGGAEQGTKQTAGAEGGNLNAE